MLLLRIEWAPAAAGQHTVQFILPGSGPARNTNIHTILLFWKVVTGLCLGVLFGLLRWKYKNAYAPALLHLAVNAFGSYIARKKRPSPQGRALSYSIEPHSVAEESVMN